MTDTASDLGILCDRLVEAIAEVGPAIANAAAQFLTTRALIELLDARGILCVAEVRERALELAVSEAAPADVVARVDQLLPDPGSSLSTPTAHGLH